MEWYKHDSAATQDAKIRKLLMHSERVAGSGVYGYAIYFHCIELITGDINRNNITFTLEHDSEIIADTLRIRGTGTKSGLEIVEELMLYMIDLGLFENRDGRITCYKLLKRLDSSMTSNPVMREIITKAKQHHDGIMPPSCKKRIEENRIEEKRVAKSKADATHELGVPINSTTYQALLSDYGKVTTDSYIERVIDYCASRGKSYRDYAATARQWMRKDEGDGKLQRRVKIERPERVYGNLPDSSE